MAHQIVDVTESIGCWHCGADTKMFLQCFNTHFGEELQYYECTKCRFTLDVSFVKEYGPKPYHPNGTAA